MIKLSEPLAVYEDLLRQTNQFDAKRKNLRQANASALLPSSDAEPLEGIFNNHAIQYRKVSDIRAAMSDAVPSELKVQTDRNRLKIYCAALKTSDLAADVQGADANNTAPQTNKAREMRRNYQSTAGQFPDCRSL